MYTVVALVVQHTGRRTTKKKWLVAFIVLDVVFCGLSLAIITILAIAGVPGHCGGLAKASIGICTLKHPMAVDFIANIRW